MGDEPAADERVVPQVPAREALQRRNVPHGKDGYVDGDNADAGALRLAEADVVLGDDRGPAPAGPKVAHELARADEDVLRARGGEAGLDAAPGGGHGGERLEALGGVGVGEGERGGEPGRAEADAEQNMREDRGPVQWRSSAQWSSWEAEQSKGCRTRGHAQGELAQRQPRAMKHCQVPVSALVDTLERLETSLLAGGNATGDGGRAGAQVSARSWSTSRGGGRVLGPVQAT